MSTTGLMPDLDIRRDPVEGEKEIIDRFIRGEITLEEFVDALPKKESEVMPSAG